MRLGDALHLTYCTNIHPGESLVEVRGHLETSVRAVKALVSPSAPFGVGLRLSARAAEELDTPGELARLRRFLDDSGLYVFTLNGFPYGKFHGARVKERVYLPDWLDDERLVYTDRLARLCAALLPAEPGLEGTVSTVPGALKTRAATDEACAAIGARLRRHVEHLARLRDETGRTIALALEPEPGCLLETLAETEAFFARHLFGGRDEEQVRRHLGVCLDACHFAVEFEEARSGLAALERARIRIAKMQISAGLAIELAGGAGEDDARAALARFAEDVYLHQVVERRGGRLTRWLDLPDALATPHADERREWRVHFHVPVHRAELGAFTSTQRELAALLPLVARAGCRHFEVETYTWDVLPEELRREDVVHAIARELSWARAHLSPA